MIEESVKKLLEVEQLIEDKKNEAENEVKRLKEEQRTLLRLEKENSKDEVKAYGESILRDQQEQLEKIRLKSEEELRQTHAGYEEKYLKNKKEAVDFILEKVRTDSGS